MSKVNIDNKECDLNSLFEDCKAQLVSIKFVEQELALLQSKAAVQTTKSDYLQAFKIPLPVVGGSDTIKLS